MLTWTKTGTGTYTSDPPRFEIYTMRRFNAWFLHDHEWHTVTRVDYLDEGKALAESRLSQPGPVTAPEGLKTGAITLPK